MTLRQRTLQMVTPVQLDASHVFRCVTVRREKVHKSIRDSNELVRYTRLEHFFTLGEYLSDGESFCTVP